MPPSDTSGFGVGGRKEGRGTSHCMHIWSYVIPRWNPLQIKKMTPPKIPKTKTTPKKLLYETCQKCP